MAGHRHSEEVKAEACRRLRNGDSVSAVSRAMGITRQTLYRWAKAQGVEAVKGYKVPHARTFDREAICAMMQTHHVDDVCERFGCSRSLAYQCYGESD